MNSLVLSPKFVSLYAGDTMVKNPDTGNWEFPLYSFDLEVKNPFRVIAPSLNTDKRYIKLVTNNIYTMITEKWLYDDDRFGTLLPYFRVNISNDSSVGQITFDPAPDRDAIKKARKYTNHVFNYIEKFFISRKIIYHILKNFINDYNLNWYDIFYNVDDFISYAVENLRSIIIMAQIGN